MTLAESFLAEFEQEAKTTRRFLERLTDDQLSWQPHEKSMTAGQLALHIAQVPGGVLQMLSADQADAPEFNRPMPQAESTAQIFAAHDESVATVRKLLPTITDERMQQPWRMMKDGQPFMELPRVAGIRAIVLNHWYHHRGQFGVYLRLLGARVPSAYGPSGDEMPAERKDEGAAAAAS